jgi:hypothetical protein
VSRINTFAHRLRKHLRSTSRSDRAGERIGVGDTIATRRNDPYAGVANRSWTSFV